MFIKSENNIYFFTIESENNMEDYFLYIINLFKKKERVYLIYIFNDIDYDFILKQYSFLNIYRLAFENYVIASGILIENNRWYSKLLTESINKVYDSMNTVVPNIITNNMSDICKHINFYKNINQEII